MTAPLSLPGAEQLAERVLIDMMRPQYLFDRHRAADRERVESDLAGLRRHGERDAEGYCDYCVEDWPCADYRDRSAALQLTASLYPASLPVGTPAREET